MYGVDVYGRVRLACPHEGLSVHEAARRFGINGERSPRFCRRRRRPVIDGRLRSVARSSTGSIAIIDRVLKDDSERPGKQRHTARRVFERLRDEHGFTDGITIVRDDVRLQKHPVLCQIERRAPRLDPDFYPYFPKANVETAKAGSYMSLVQGAQA